MSARTLQIAVAIFFMAALSPMLAFEHGLSPIISRADFKVRNPKFAKVVEKEINQRGFRQKLARTLSMSVASALIPIAKVSYKPDDEQGGILVMSFEDPKNKLAHDELVRLWNKVEAYVVHRFQGNNSKDSEVWAFGESAAEK